MFNWISPIMYATTMLGSPLFQILFFTYVGKAYTTLPERFFIVGNAVQVSAMSGIYAATMTIANERRLGTLSPLLATPANRVVLYFLLLLFCGVNVPQEELPGWMQAIGNAMPMTHGIKAAREVAAGGSISASAGLVVAELLVGLVWGTVGSALFKLFEVESRRRASLDTF